ncbi:uncharacterized protein LOC114303815 [Camellia sinensis]|uniref:uncharacterized protein LOC114303815 n=1 Tax=Camellia sinensis TaxID=4442 RepID=UPI0010368DAD|nr:uncharacterized protein LOC114303815 [Camellia sinensis]
MGWLRLVRKFAYRIRRCRTLCVALCEHGLSFMDNACSRLTCFEISLENASDQHASTVGEEIAREIVRAVREALTCSEGDESRALKITKEFFRLNPPEFTGGVEPLEAESWLEQVTKTLDILRVTDEGLRVSLASFLLKREVGYWWKYVSSTVGTTWVAITEAFWAKYFPPSTRERLRKQFVELRQGMTPLAQFEAQFTSSSRFAPELVATEEWRCIEFEEKLHDEIKGKVVGCMHRNYHTLVEAAAHVEATNLKMDQDERERAITTSPIA